MNYEEFLAGKAIEAPAVGIDTAGVKLPPQLFPFQRDTVLWALNKGRAAVFFQCGLGKTAIQLAWAGVVAKFTGKPVLILAPLSVSLQTKREGDKFSIPVNVAKDQSEVVAGINITNYERLSKFDASTFGGVVIDESSILKAFMGATKNAILAAFISTPFKLCCTATPAPNDHMELGNHCEFLGVLPSHEMLARWFMADQSCFGTYVLRGHAVEPFWDWVASWARCADMPSDLGYSDDGFVLPPLDVRKLVVGVDVIADREQGTLFRMPKMSATSVHEEKRRTARARAEAIARLVAAEPNEQWLLWTDTDYEAAELKKAIPESVEVSGKTKDELKEQIPLDFVDGKIRVLLSKSKIFGLGMNFQSCARVAYIGPSFSYEQFYQSLRRVHRFGQKRHVHAYVCLATTEVDVWDVIQHKANEHDTMKRAMRDAMRRAQQKESRTVSYLPTHIGRIPQWLKTA